MNKMQQQSNVSVFDWSTTIPVLVIVTGIVIVLWIFPETSADIINNMFDFVTDKLGWLFLFFVFAVLIYTLYLGFSRYGNIKLGEEEPEFSTYTWIAMLFSAALGAGLVFYGTAEPISFFSDPPIFAEVEAETIEAARFAVKRAFFHWGLSAWVLYTFAAMAIGHAVYNLHQPSLISSTFYPIWGDRVYKGLGKTVNALSSFVTIGGISTTLGLIILQICGGLSYCYSVKVGLSQQIAIGITLEIITILATVTGLKRGIKYLGHINMVLFFFLMVFVLLVGPTLFILDLGVSAVGDYLIDLIPMSLFADPLREAGSWLGDWTIFYWAWWIAWTPFVSLFIARISKGRTIRELVIGGIFIPVVMTFLWFAIMGGGAIYYDINRITSIANAINTFGIEVASFEFLKHLPISFITIPIMVFLIAAFFITSNDSAAFTLSMMNTRGLEEPPSSARILWGVSMGALGISLLVRGGMTALQTISLLVAIPFMVVLAIMGYAMHISFKRYAEG